MTNSSHPLATAVAYGKTILSGEHSVVYGHPAIVSQISLKMHVLLFEDSFTASDLEYPYVKLFNEDLSIFKEKYPEVTDKLPVHLTLSVTGDLPLGFGLGGSAAVASASFQALAQLANKSLSPEELLELVQLSENFAHGKSSGVDATAVVHGGLLEFRKKDQQLWHQPIITSALEKRPFFLLSSGKPVESTKEMVMMVKDRMATDPTTKKILKQIGEVTTEFISELKQNTFEPILLQKNERLLEELGVVSPAAQSLISQIEAVGGFAKITGAGGLKEGSGMILAYHSDPFLLEEFSTQHNLYPYQIFFTQKKP